MYRFLTTGGPRKASCRLIVAALALGNAGSGIAASATRHVEAITPAVVNSSLETLSSERNKEHLREIIEVLDVERSSAVVAQQSVTGAMAALSDPAVAASLQDFVAAMVAGVMAEMAHSLAKELGPSARDELQVALKSALGPGTRDQLSAASAEITLAFSESFAQGIEKEIAPAAMRALRRELAPQLRETIATDLVPELAAGSRLLAREAMLGVNDALQGELGVTVQKAYDQALIRFEESLEAQGSDLGWWLAGILFLLAIGLLVVAVMWRRKAGSSAGREQALILLGAALQREGEADSGKALLEAIQSLEGTGQSVGYRQLAEALAKHQQQRADHG